MKERRIDLRTQKTYDALICAFEELLQEKTFENITIRELCEKARTRTATFYNHFSDKYDFFSFMIRSMRRDFFEEAVIESNTKQPEDFYVQYMKISMQFLEKNQYMIHALTSDTLITAILNSSSTEGLAFLCEHIREDHKKGYDFPADDEIMAQSILGIMSRCIEYWFHHRKEADQSYILEQFRAILHTLYQISPRC